MYPLTRVESKSQLTVWSPRRLVFCPEVSELIGRVTSQILWHLVLLAVFWNICHYLKARLII